MLELTIRLVVSLTIVVGLLLLLARFGSRKFRGNASALVHVVHRQPLSRTSAVAVVTVGSRVLVLGTTEQQVRVLAELDPDELEVEDVVEMELVRDQREPFEPVAPQPAKRSAGSHRASPAPQQPRDPARGPLVGSVLSPQTWRQALSAVRRAS